jgi:hypothetical protein
MSIIVAIIDAEFMKKINKLFCIVFFVAEMLIYFNGWVGGQASF